MPAAPRAILHRLALGIALISAPTLLSAQQSDSCDGMSLSRSYTQSEFNSGGVEFTWTHKAGDTTTVSVSGAYATLKVEVTGGSISGATLLCQSARECDNGVFLAPTDGDYRFLVSGDMATQSGRVQASCRGDAAPAGSSSTGPGTGGSASGSISDGEEIGQLLTRSVAAAGGAAAGSIGAAISTATGGGADGISASRDGLRFALSDREGSRLAGWAEIRGRLFSGSIGGSGVEATLGADIAIGESLLGAVASYGTYDLTFAGAAVSAEAVSYGPYASLQLGRGWALEGYLVFARPTYSTGTTSISAERVAAGLRLETLLDVRGASVTGFVGARGFSESLPAVTLSGTALPAHSLSSWTGSLGAMAEFSTVDGLRPYLSGAVEFNRFDDGLGTVSEAISPRIGAGVKLDVAGGEFVLHLDGGQLFKGVNDYSASLRYRLEF